MSALCVAGAGLALALATDAFTLAWTHSVERTAWQEDWRVEPGGLRLVAARVKGSGAGMEPGEGARLEDGWWRWTVSDRPPLPELALAMSGATVSGWSLCVAGLCRPLDGAPGTPVTLRPCP